MRIKCLISIVLTAACASVHAQQVDPTLTAAVAAQSAVLRQLYNERTSTEKKILAAEAAVTLSINRLHDVEDKILGYLSNAQGAMQNLYQIKRAAELVATEIPHNIAYVTSGIPGHLKGTAVSTVVSRQISDATTQMMSLYPFMQQLVTSGSYNVNGPDGIEKHKVNLLNSAERYYIANEIVSRLERINRGLYIFGWQIRTLGFNNLWFSLDPKGWARAASTKAIAQSIITQWNRAR